MSDETLEDWVSYSDHIVIADVTDEKRLGLDNEEDRRNGEGLVGRQLTIEIIDSLYRRTGSLELPPVVSFGHTGWRLKDGKEIPMGVMGATRMEVGHRYLIPLTYWLRQEGGWGFMTSTGSIEIVDGRIETIGGEGRPAALAIGGLTPDEARDVFAKVEPHPAAAAHPDLPADERYDLVSAEG